MARFYRCSECELFVIEREEQLVCPGCRDKALTEGQRAFFASVDEFLEALDASLFDIPNPEKRHTDYCIRYSHGHCVCDEEG